MWRGLFVLAVVLPLGAQEMFWRADDAAHVKRSGDWAWTSHRYAANGAFATSEDGAALEVTFTGRGLVLCLDTLTPPNNFGPPPLGALEIVVDGARVGHIRPRTEDREVQLARSDSMAPRRVRLVHRRDGDGAGCRVVGFRVIDHASGDLAWLVSAERNNALVDVRAIVTREGVVVRDALVRNWLTGQCRLAGLPAGAGYGLELRASGWQTWRSAPFAIEAGKETELPPVYLCREHDAPADSFVFPRFGHPVVRQAAGAFRMRLDARSAEVRAVRLVRRQGPAVISRACRFEENQAARFYYYREGTVTLPGEVPAGVYDLEATLALDGETRVMIAPRSVTVVREFPRDPVCLSFGHLDTWGQHQAEYLARLVAIANLVAPDLVLDANEANPAYAAGALAGLEMPFVVNFGNHRGPEPATWFGEPVGIVDLGPHFSVLNFGLPWDASTAEAERLFAARASVPLKIINAFESNAPVADLLDRHRIALIHYAHGPGPHVARMGATPTLRVGKVNSESFRLLRFREGKPVSVTYRGDAVAPIPFPRAAQPPVRVRFEPASDGTHREMTARVHNDLEEALPNARVVFVAPRGDYAVEGGRLEARTDSDDGRFTVVTTRCDLPAGGGCVVRLVPQR